MRPIQAALLLLLIPGWIGCTRLPRPAAPLRGPSVFAVTGDTSEVLSRIPDPVSHPRPAGALADDAREEEGDEAPPPADTAITPLVPLPDPKAPNSSATPATPATLPSPSAPAPAPATNAPEPRFRVQIFAGEDRPAAYREAQRAVRELRVREEDVAILSEGPAWKVRLGVGLGRPEAEALLSRARASFPGSFLVPEPGGRRP